jgi:hypothetical protein
MDDVGAQVLAAQVLGWLAGEDELWDVFVGATGADVNDIKSKLQDPEFLSSVLDFVMMDDAWVMRACSALSVPNETLMRARQSLPGGALREWT